MKCIAFQIRAYPVVKLRQTKSKVGILEQFWYSLYTSKRKKLFNKSNHLMIMEIPSFFIFNPLFILENSKKGLKSREWSDSSIIPRLLKNSLTSIDVWRGALPWWKDPRPVSQELWTFASESSDESWKNACVEGRMDKLSQKNKFMMDYAPTVRQEHWERPIAAFEWPASSPVNSIDSLPPRNLLCQLQEESP